MEFKRILYPTDFSQASLPAWQVAKMLARQSSAELIVMHVDAPTAHLPAPVTSGYGLPVMFTPEARVEQAGEVLQRVFSSGDGAQVRHLVVSGDPADQILEVARREHVDLIVIGTHGHTGMLRLLMGSVAESIVRRAPCPVLTLRGGNA